MGGFLFTYACKCSQVAFCSLPAQPMFGPQMKFRPRKFLTQVDNGYMCMVMAMSMWVCLSSARMLVKAARLLPKWPLEGVP